MLERLETLALDSWTGPHDAGLKARAVSALERGAVLFFPHLPFLLFDAEKQFLDAGVSDGQAKNISLDHTTGKMQASALTGEKARELAAMMERFGSQATRLVHELLPYRNVERARTSFRPVQVKGRHYSRISDDRLLHIDAFPSRPMRGRRILRFFANVAPNAPRHWHVGQPFEDFARAFLPRVGPHVSVKAWPGKSWLYERLGVTRGRRSLYDELMLSLHDTGKLDENFQANSPHEAIEFPPGCCWLVFTDQVLHAALGGEFALEQTFHLDIQEMAEPERAPVNVLERLSGKTLI
ncbi:MAG TPA: Kdo hydroxylase family protein [Rhizomicrobium sp.]|nr:Kdo hydroxylase family protein [Rhizomicrobium sp.]